ncbi:hypothetical protein [Pararhodobacter zhoushanensis]|uniref:hypothetical protein n=1 Tax=Pararhodobacter zhoushanensis TaxID=2479545 RepID=UPI000F8F39B2|nr:hypothetical protein [Pararhodobacter zhoushanensis]
MLIELGGARLRAERERSLTWFGAMMPHLKKRPSHDEFVRPKPRATRQSREELNAVLMALATAWGAEWVDK